MIDVLNRAATKPAAPIADAAAGSPAMSLARHCEPGGAEVRVRADAPFSDAIEAFRGNARLRILPVTDAEGRPVGAIFEQDARAILYNPYGHALLNNPAFNSAAIEHCRTCPTADQHMPLPDLLETFARSEGAEGLILTAGGRLLGILSSRTLIHLAAEREADIAQARMIRLELAAAAGERFIADIGSLAAVLARVATGIEDAAAATAHRTEDYGRRVAAVAAAAGQTANGMQGFAAQGAGLAGTIDSVRADTMAAREAAAEAVSLSAASLLRGRALAEAATAIDGTLATVQAIASQVKLLAINAAIETARMGPEGAGFAVVARELKHFALRTNDAAAEIAGRIAGVHEVSQEVIAGQGAIGTAVRIVEAVTQSIDEAVSIQAATARLFADNAGQALDASTEINANVSEISHMIDQAAQGSVAMAVMASELTAETVRLRDRVATFVSELRANDRG